MLLILDAGNSRLKWGAWDGSLWLEKRAVDYAGLDAQVEEWLRLKPTWVGVSCVAGKTIQDDLAGRVETLAAQVYWLAAAAACFGMTNRYQQPSQLGVDRYAALFACHCLQLAPCVVVSAGTALTVDALSSGSEFLGGMIAPGLGLMRRSLQEGTSGLSALSGGYELFPRSTGDAVETGIWTMLAGAAESMRERLQGREAEPVKMILTGGNATELAEYMSGPCTVMDDLVLEGMLWLARRMHVQGA